LPDNLYGLDLWKSKLTRHIGVDWTGVQTQDLRALLAGQSVANSSTPRRRPWKRCTFRHSEL
jgi:hypothetical protein